MADYFDPNEAAGEIVKQALNSEPVTNLLGPLTENIGLTLGLISDVGRYYSEINLAKIFKKWDQHRSGKPLDEKEIKRVLPLLRDAAMQSDDELQERWATLLESATKSSTPLTASFGLTLSRLAPDEAKFLDRLSGALNQNPYGGQPGEHLLHELIGLYYESCPEVFMDEVLVRATISHEVQAQAEFAVEHLIHLGALQKRIEAFTTGGGYGQNPDAATSEWYSLSLYGRRFHDAVSLKIG